MKILVTDQTWWVVFDVPGSEERKFIRKFSFLWARDMILSVGLRGLDEPSGKWLTYTAGLDDFVHYFVQQRGLICMACSFQNNLENPTGPSRDP
jgi:hypothetical protein